MFQVFRSIERKPALWSAKLETYLTTHAFEILFFIIFLVANILQFLRGAYDGFHYIRTVIEPVHPTWTDYKWYIAIARSGGYVLNLNFALIILLSARKFLTALRETPLHNVLPIDKAFPKAHIIVGWAIAIGIAIHVPFHFALKFNQFDRFTLWSFSMTFSLGIPLLLIFIGMFVMSLPRYRHKYFRTFYITHLVCAALMFPLLILHGVDKRVPETYKWVLPAIIIYIIDRIVRRLQITNATLQLTGAESTLKAGGIIELRLSKLFKFRAGQYAEIIVPEISNEAHPFTIASAPHEDSMLFYIKQSGDWTTKLAAAFQERIQGTVSRPLFVRVRGPFGAPAQHTKSYKRVVLISAGVGATPFMAISKHLHHKATSNNSQHYAKYDKFEPDYNLDDASVLDRLNEAIRVLYDLQDDGKPLDPVVRTENAKHITKALELSSAERKETSTVSESSFEFDSTGQCAIDMKKEETFPRRFSGFNSLRARTLSLLHTTRLSFFLLLSLVLRFSIVCIVAIWRKADFGMMETAMKPNAYWALGVDAVLGLLLTIIMLSTLALEMSYLRSKFFNRAGRCLDLFAFLPLSLITTAATFQSWTSPTAQGALTIMHFALFLPLLFLLLAYRLYRSVGSKDLLDYSKPRCSCCYGHSIPEVDYVWATRMNDHDEWVRDSLSHLSNGSELRLHRYVTREKEVKQIEDHITSNIGRPDWYNFFCAVSNSTRSHGAVGVFFCGPVPMGSSIKKILREVEVRSHLRGAYLSALSDDEIARDFDIKNQVDVLRLRRTGCNVRFVFREENF